MGVTLRHSLSYSVILLSIIEMLLKMSFYRLLSYFVDASLLDSARRHFLFTLKYMAVFMVEMSLSEVAKIYLYISKSSF